jgi:phasin family protein
MTTKQKMDEAVATGRAMAEQGAAAAQKGFEQAQAYAQDNLTKGMKATEEMVAFAQGNVEAVTRSTQVFVAGLQDLSKAAIASAQQMTEEAMTKAREFASVRSVKDAMELQAAFMRHAMEKTLAETQKFGEGYFRLTEQAWAPINARVQLAVEKFGKAA